MFCLRSGSLTKSHSCGNAIINGGALSPTGGCNMPCSGDATQTCGGPVLMDIYARGTLQIQPAPIVQTAGLPSNWSYQGCIVDAPALRTLPVEMEYPTTNSATVCLNYCSLQGYKVAGLEYASQCFCGSGSDLSGAGPVNSTGCDMVCSGDEAYLCGGPDALTYYTLS